MPTSSIDDLLMGAGTPQHPETPENVYLDNDDVEIDEPETADAEPETEQEPKDDHTNSPDHPDGNDETPESDHKKEYDDYGNEKEPENEVIRERLARQARKHQAEIDALRAQLQQQGASQQVQQAAQDFEYDPDAKGDWQQQLAAFVEQTVDRREQKRQQAQQQQAEQAAHAEFEEKLINGMSRFDDFRDVVGQYEITNPMTLATRGMADPAAFLYAAAKRNPDELQRIAKIKDPYAQITEMGKLEERMRRNKPTTKAPRPIGRTPEDASTPVAKKKQETSIEDLIAKSDAKRLQRMKARRGAR